MKGMGIEAWPTAGKNKVTHLKGKHHGAAKRGRNHQAVFVRHGNPANDLLGPSVLAPHINASRSIDLLESARFG
jgi:hypothetical protein